MTIMRSILPGPFIGPHGHDVRMKFNSQMWLTLSHDQVTQSVATTIIFFKLFLVALSILGHPLSKHEVFNLKKKIRSSFSKTIMFIFHFHIFGLSSMKNIGLYFCFYLGVFLIQGVFFPAGLRVLSAGTLWISQEIQPSCHVSFIENCIRRRKMYFVYY